MSPLLTGGLYQISANGTKRKVILGGGSIQDAINTFYRSLDSQRRLGKRWAGLAETSPIWCAEFEGCDYFLNNPIVPKQHTAVTMLKTIMDGLATKYYPRIEVGHSYSKVQIQDALEENTLVNSTKLSPGVFYCKTKPLTLLFVDLDKSDKEERFKFNDYFDGPLFHWDSQPKQHIDVPSIQDIVTGVKIPLLFVRTHSRVKGVTQPFVFCGRLEYESHDEATKNPVHIVFKVADYIDEPGSELASVYNWSKGVSPEKLARKLIVSSSQSEELSEQRRVNQNDSIDTEALAPELASSAQELLPDGPSEKLIIQKIRTQQGAFRRALLERYNSTCCLCGLQDPKLLIASHIKPFAECSEAERQDSNNGLLLSVHIDALFDKGLISFYNDGTIIISPKLGRKTQTILNIKAGMRLTSPLNDVQRAFMQYHRSSLLK